jgi:hypothetical protein
MVENEIVALEAGVTYAQAAAAVSAGWTAGTAGGAIASFGGAIAGGAAGGFVSGASLGAMSGQHLGEALQSGLKGAEFGALQGGIAAGMADLNNSFSALKINQFSMSDPSKDLIGIAARGLEGAVTSELEGKNASAGFWSGLFSAAGTAFKPAAGANVWWVGAGDDLAQGVIGGIGSMNKRGQGFMNGFWSAESSALTSDAANNWLDNKLVATTTWEKDFTGIAEKGILGGAVSRFGRKTFSSGFFTGFGAEALKDGIFGLEELAGNNPEKPGAVTSPVNAAFKLLQPKITKGGTTYPLDSISGGYWGVGAPWAQLYAPPPAISAP